MKYLVVELVNEDTDFDRKTGRMRLNIAEYQEIIQTGREAGALDKLLKHVNFTCVKCGAFTIPAVPFCEIVRNEESLFDLSDIAFKLLELVELTEEELIRRENYGQQSVEKIKDAILFDWNEEWTCRFIFDEIFFLFNSKCDCTRII